MLDGIEYQRINDLMHELLQLAPLASPRGQRCYEALAIHCADCLIEADRAKSRQSRQARRKRQAIQPLAVS